MGRNAISGEIAKCHECGVEAVLDGWGRCGTCFDREVDAWIAPAPQKQKFRNPEWDKKYYETHKSECKRRSVECHRRRVLEHPEMLIKDRERQRKIREASRHPCVDCGEPCNKESVRCRPCYYALLRSRGNPWRQHRLVLSKQCAMADVVFDARGMKLN